jgi:hypothetical protein
VFFYAKRHYHTDMQRLNSGCVAAKAFEPALEVKA